MLRFVVRLGFQTSIHLRIVKHVVKISMFSPEYVLIWIEYDPSD